MREYSNRYVMEEGFMNDDQQKFMIEFIGNKKEIKKILEIGFNGGHGTCALLSARDDVHVTSVDLGEHSYVDKANELIEECFPGRHILIKGNSTEVLPMLNENFDCVFVDGGHEDPVPYIDIVNSHKLLNDDGILMVDDYCQSYGRWGVIDGYNRAIRENLYSHIDVFTFYDRGVAIARKLKFNQV